MRTDNMTTEKLIIEGDRVRMKDIPIDKRTYKTRTNFSYITFTILIGAEGTVKGIHLHFYEVDWDLAPKVNQIDNPVINHSKGWVVSKEHVELVYNT